MRMWHKHRTIIPRERGDEERKEGEEKRVPLSSSGCMVVRAEHLWGMLTQGGGSPGRGCYNMHRSTLGRQASPPSRKKKSPPEAFHMYSV